MNRYIFTLIMAVVLWPLSLFADGNDDDRKLTNISVAEDSVLAGFSIGDSITFNTNFDSLCGGFRERIIESGTKNIIYEAFNSVKNEKDEWVLKFYEDVVLQKGHTYTLEIEGHEVADSKSKATGKVSVIYIGDGEKGQGEVDDYEYSNIKYLRFNPNDKGELSSLRLNFISVQFSGEVKIDADRTKIFDLAGNEYNFTHIMPIENLENYWQFTIPLDLMMNCTDSLRVRIYAIDLAGHAVKGIYGNGENSYYELTFKCSFGYPELSVSPESGSFMSLKDFSFFNSKSNDSIQILDGEKEIKMLASNNQVVASFKAGDLEMSADELSFTYSLEQAIETVGNYLLMVPEGTFALGKKGLGNHEVTVVYEINSKLKMYGVESIDPEEGSEVTSLSKFIITFDDIAVPDYFNQQKITLTNSDDEVVTTAKAMIDEDRENYKQCIIVLDTPINTPGDYRLNIPENLFALGQWGNYRSKEMTFDYTIVDLSDSIGNITVETEADGEHMLDRVRVNFNPYGSVYVVGVSNYESISVILTDTSNNQVAEGRLHLGQFYNQLVVDEIKCTVDSIGPKLPKGTYVLHIEKEKLVLDGEVYPVELALKFHFDPAYDVNVKTYADADKKLDGVDIIFTPYAEVDLKDSRNITYYDITVTDSLNNVIATAQVSKNKRFKNQLYVDYIETVDELKGELGDKLGKGKYWLHIPANIMILDGETYDLEYVLAFEFDPISVDMQMVNAPRANDRVRVYSAQGMLSRDEKDPETALRGLRRGLYIINGRKVLIK